MRNVLAYEYSSVDSVMVWETIQIHLDTLRQALEIITEQPTPQEQSPAEPFN